MSGAKPDFVFLCDWLPPDFGAVGQYSLQRARQMAAAGQRVCLYGLSSMASSREVPPDSDGRLTVVRLRAGTYDRSSFVQRARWTMVTNLRLIAAAWRDLRSAGTIMFTGSPPFLLHFLAPLNCLLRRRLVYRITDFFPECVMAERPRGSWALRLLYRLTLFWRRRVSQFEALGEDQRRRLLDIGIPPERIAIRRDDCPVRIDPGTVPLERPALFRDRRVLLYSGNFGVAHEYATFLAAYARHHRAGSARTVLWLNAVGAGARALSRALTVERLPFHASAPVPLEDLPRLLVTADAHLITLREPFAGFVLPSKVYGCLESGKPILYIGPRDSDLHLLCSPVRPGAAYWHADVGDVDGVFHALENLAHP